MTLARKWVTLGQAAEATGRSERTIQRWVADERLAAVDLDGTRFVNELALLHVERDTRRAAQAGRPGVRLRADLTSGVVLCRQAEPRSAPERSR